MSNLALIIVCLALGLLLQRSSHLPKQAPATLNFYVIYVALPAMVLTEIPKLTLDQEAMLPIVSTWVVMSLTVLLIWWTARWRGWSRPVTGAMMLIIPLGNTSFVGIPLIQALLPGEAMPYAILYDQFGTMIALNTYGVVVAAWYAGRNASLHAVAKTIATFPPFIALLLAFALFAFEYPSWFSYSTERIAQSLVPVVMVAVGLQWRLKLERQYLSPALFGLCYKLVLIPALVIGLFYSLGWHSISAQAVALQAAMPAMISAGVLAISHNLAPRLVSTVVGYGLLLSLMTVPLWSLVLQ